MGFGYRVMIFFSIVLIVGLAGCAGRRTETSGGNKTAESLFEEKCSFCHGLNLALEENHTLDGWRKLVRKEAGRKIWFINSTEQEIITRYLFEISPAEKEKPPREKDPGKGVHDNPENVGEN